MSHRTENEPLIQMLRKLQDRIDRLEKGDKGIRQNDIRLGDMLVTTNAETNQVCIKNLVTGAITCFGEAAAAGGAPLAGWSFSGDVDFNADTALDYSPPYVVPENTTAVRIVIASRVAFTGTVRVCINFGTIQRQIILLGATLNSVEINVPLVAYDKITCHLLDAGTGCKNLSVFVWFSDKPTVALSASNCT